MNISQKQSVDALRMVLFRRPLHPELFDIHGRRVIEQGGYDAELWVTGCSHVTRFSCGDRSMVEVIAAADHELPQRGLVASFRCRGERRHEYTLDGHVRYLMNFQVDTMSPRVFEKTHLDLFQAGRKSGVLIPLPQWQTGKFVPFSHVELHAGSNDLHVVAYHVFPEELTVLKSQTIFELI